MGRNTKNKVHAGWPWHKKNPIQQGLKATGSKNNLGSGKALLGMMAANLILSIFLLGSDPGGALYWLSEDLHLKWRGAQQPFGNLQPGKVTLSLCGPHKDDDHYFTLLLCRKLSSLFLATYAALHCGNSRTEEQGRHTDYCPRNPGEVVAAKSPLWQ